MATEPRSDHTYEERPSRPHVVHRPTRTRSTAWIWVVIGLVVLAAIAVVGYLILYNGTGGYGGGTGGGAGGGGYVVLALSAGHVRRAVARVRHPR